MRYLFILILGLSATASLAEEVRPGRISCPVLKALTYGMSEDQIRAWGVSLRLSPDHMAKAEACLLPKKKRR